MIPRMKVRYQLQITIFCNIMSFLLVFLMVWIGTASIEDFRYVHRTWSLLTLGIIIFILLMLSIELNVNSHHRDLEQKITISNEKIKELEKELEILKRK